MFADTSGWASLVDRRQTYHGLTATLVQQAHADGQVLVTTNYVPAELTALLSRRTKVLSRGRLLRQLEVG